jgi:hypothetical protein
MPIFHGLDSKMLEHSTGEMLEVKCKITQIPMMYSEIINQNEFFSYEKEEHVAVPFGLKVMDVEPYGLVDSFKINTWLIGSLDPAPYFKQEKKGCLSCANLFGYMKVYPVD